MAAASSRSSRAHPAAHTGKRKRDVHEKTISLPSSKRLAATALQIVTGSYERVLHGLIATISPADLSSDDKPREATFSDQFLFNAHASSIRCLALSPAPDANPEQQHPKRILATGGADERINLYSLSASAPLESESTSLSSILPLTTAVDGPSRNRELGSLMHHSSTISRLQFVSRGKLLSASQDNTIAIARTRDWTVLSTIRAPVPKPAGRPSGDTAAPGEVPAGVNDVAVHPSAKLCLSVGQGERCMRLWNLVTGKKAGVLTFERPILSLLGEGRWRGGEGRSVVWCDDGDEFAVGFERGAVIYGLDCQVRGVARISGTKICQMRYIPRPGHSSDSTSNGVEATNGDETKTNILAVSTEDGRVLFFNTDGAAEADEADAESLLLKPVGQLGSVSRGNRVKDFQVFEPPGESQAVLIVTGNSDGAVSIWNVARSELTILPGDDSVLPSHKRGKVSPVQMHAEMSDKNSSEIVNVVKQVGNLLGTCQTGRRITCLTGFFMDAATSINGIKKDEEVDEEEWEGLDGAGEENGGASDDSATSDN